MIAAVNLLIILLIAFSIWKTQPAQIRGFFWPAILIKMLSGICLGLIYKYYYTTGDTFMLFDQAAAQSQKFFHDPQGYFSFLWDSGSDWKGQLRSSFFVKIVSVFSLITNSSYWITSLWFSLIIFVSTWYLVRVIIRFFPAHLIPAVIAFLFFPSVVFWSSGIIKECLALSGLLLLAGIYLKLMHNQKPTTSEIFLALPAFWVLWNLKYYWAAAFLLIAGVSLFVHVTSQKENPWWRIAMWGFSCVALCVVISYLHPNFNLSVFPEVLYQNHEAFVPISTPENMIHFYNFQPTWESIILNSPWALVSGLFRPFLWEAHNITGIAAAVENFIILLMFIMTIGKIRLSGSWLLVLSVIVYSAVLCVFLALSTPNLGSLARYKVGFTPFLIFILACSNPFVKRLISKHVPLHS